ncbi:hypothetical protein FRC03_010785 [Tulasnella sp. 419]|nr:hypothetical protein FRC03_010785 [Tulasnella sp. 419]
MNRATFFSDRAQQLRTHGAKPPRQKVHQKDFEKRQKQLEKERHSNLMFADKQTRRLMQQQRLEDPDDDGWYDVNTSEETPDNVLHDQTYDISHEGGEYQEYIVDMNARASYLMGSKRFNHARRESIVRGERLQRAYIEWKKQLDMLSDAYLEMKHGDLKEQIDDTTTEESWSIKVVSMEDGIFNAIIPSVEEDIHVNVTLIKRGYLGSSPVTPAVAFSLQTLEDYRLERNECGRFSILHKVKVIANKFRVPFKKYLRDQFQDAFYAYLMILENLDSRVKERLRRNATQWQQKNVCPCCTYELEGEEEMQYRMLVAIDGNNSCKRDATAGKSDGRVYDTSRIYISREEVDSYQNEVRRKSKTQGVMKECFMEATPSSCTDNWKADAPEHHKSMWANFDESGFFISACRHHCVLTICDMVCSGELAKYPLATVAKLLELYGNGLGIGYDIGCSMSGTVDRSPLLGESFRQSGSQFAVPAFHGWGHNRLCQLQHHIRMVDGFGLEDLETCERVFSASNAIARPLRHCSSYTRHLFVTQYFGHWNREMRNRLGHTLFLKAKAAVRTLASENTILDQFKNLSRITDNLIFEDWLQQEENYLKGLKQEPEHDINTIEYVELLRDFYSAKKRLEAINMESTQWVSSTPQQMNVAQTASGTAKIENARRHALSQFRTLEKELERVETKMGITETWLPTCPEWKSAMNYIETREYRRAIDKVELLIVQRLFELQKLNLSGTGYKLRTHIAKALKARSSALRTALDKYNVIAGSMNPKRPTLSWSTVVEYCHVSHFDLLRDCRQDISQKEWALPANRAATQAYLKVKRANEELKRLRIEVRRLQTWIHDESAFLSSEYQRLLATEPLLAKEIQLLLHAHQQAAGTHQFYLTKIGALEGFDVDLSLGVRRGCMDALPGTVEATEHCRSEVRQEDLFSAVVEEAEALPRLPEDDEDLAEVFCEIDEYVSGIHDE